MSITANEGKDISKIVLCFEDGSTREIDKGFIAKIEPAEQGGQTEITFNMIGISGNDLKVIIGSMVELGLKFGMFDGGEDDEEDCDDEN